MAKFIAKNKIDGFKDEDIEILNINDLKISIIDKNKNISKGEEIGLNIKGNATLVWLYNEEQLKLDLVDKNKKILIQFYLNIPVLKKQKLL